MVSFEVTSYDTDSTTFSFKGLTTDEKPTGTFEGRKIANGSSFFAMDTQDVYFYDGNTNQWLTQP